MILLYHAPCSKCQTIPIPITFALTTTDPYSFLCHDTMIQLRAILPGLGDISMAVGLFALEHTLLFFKYVHKCTYTHICTYIHMHMHVGTRRLSQSCVDEVALIDTCVVCCDVSMSSTQYASPSLPTGLCQSIFLTHILTHQHISAT